MKRIIPILLVMMLFISFNIFADNQNNNTDYDSAPSSFYIEANYNFPFQTTSNIYETASFGLGYKFWGIFVLKGEMFTEIEYGADNLLNIKTITPIGLFSIGFGMHINMGDFTMIWDWAPMYQRTTNGLAKYSQSSKFGFAIDLTSTIKLELYKRDLYNFSNLTIDQDKVRMLGIGVIWYLL